MALLPRLNHQHTHRKKTRNKRLLPSKIVVCLTSVFILVVFVSSESFASLKRERFKVFSISRNDVKALAGFGKGRAFTRQKDEETNERGQKRTLDDASLENHEYERKGVGVTEERLKFTDDDDDEEDNDEADKEENTRRSKQRRGKENVEENAASNAATLSTTSTANENEENANNKEKMSPRKIAFLSMPKQLSKKHLSAKSQAPQTLSEARVKLNEGLRHVKNEQKMRREITRSIKQHTTVAKRTAKFVGQRSSSDSSSGGSSSSESNSESEERRNEESNENDEGGERGGEQQHATTDDPQKMTEIDRLAWEINTKEFTKSKFPWADPFVVLCERYSRFLRNGVRYKTVPWANLVEDINAKYEADGQTITSNTEMLMVTFAIERLKEIHDEESRVRTKLEEIERKLIASARESSSKALERLKADSGMADVDDDDDGKENEGDKGAKDPALSTSRGGRPNGRNNKQYLVDEREFNEEFIPKVRKLAKALLKDVQWVHDEDSEEYKNMYATYDNFHKSHSSGERIDEKDIQVPKGVSLGEFEKRFLPENGQAYPSGKKKPSCALVGNSRALLANDRLGEQIDDHDVVMRLNQAPSKRFEKYVGHKTTHRLLNAKWTQAYKSNPYLQTEPNVTFVITRTDWLTYLRAAKVMANLKPNYFPKNAASSASFSSSEEEDNGASSNNNNNAIGGDTTAMDEFGDIVPVENSKMPSDEQDVDIAERVKQGMPTLRLLSRSAVDGAGDVLRALKQNLEIVRGKAYKGKASPSSGFLGFHLLRQFCDTLDVYGVGDDIAFTGAAWHYFETQHFQSSREFGAVPHHSFTLESDVMQLLDATEQIRHQRVHVDKETMQRLEFMKGAPIREIRAPQNLGRIANAQAKREQNKKAAASSERPSSSFGGSGGLSHAESSMMKRGYGSAKKRSGGSKAAASKKESSFTSSKLDSDSESADPLSGLV